MMYEEMFSISSANQIRIYLYFEKKRPVCMSIVMCDNIVYCIV